MVGQTGQAQFYDSKYEIELNLEGLSYFFKKEKLLKYLNVLRDYNASDSLISVLGLLGNDDHGSVFPGNEILDMIMAYDKMKDKSLDFYVEGIKLELERNDECKKGLQLILGDIFCHKVNLANIISDDFSFLLHNFHKNNFIQGLCLSTYIYEAKGVLLLLKILSEKVLTIEADIIDNIVVYNIPEEAWQDFGSLSLEESVSQKLIYLLWKIIRCNFLVLIK